VRANNPRAGSSLLTCLGCDICSKESEFLTFDLMC
jgi:hypothetical protein